MEDAVCGHSADISYTEEAPKVNMIWRAESSYLSLSHMHETDSATFSKTSLSEHPQDPSADVPINNMVPSAKNNQKLSGILVTSQPPKHQNRPV